MRTMELREQDGAALAGAERQPHAAAVLGPVVRGATPPSHAYLFHGPAGAGKRALATRAGDGAAGGGGEQSGDRRRARAPRQPSRPHVGTRLGRRGDARRRHRGAGRGGGDHDAVRVRAARVRDRGRRAHERPGCQQAPEDARGAARLRAPRAAHRPLAGRAADDRLALPARPLRPAAARSDRGRARRAWSRSVRARARAWRSATRRSRGASRARRARRCRAAAETFVRSSAGGRDRRDGRGPRCSRPRARRAPPPARRPRSGSNDELELIPGKERKRHQREGTEARRRVERRARTATLELGLRLAELWLRDVLCVALDAQELVHAVDRNDAAERGCRAPGCRRPPARDRAGRRDPPVACRSTSPRSSRSKRWHTT